MNFKNKIGAFVETLNTINIDELVALPYPIQYAKHTLQNKEYFTCIYANCLQHTYTNNSSFENDTLIDFGCGNGFLALFTAFCGCKNVVAVEVREEFIALAKTIATQLNIKNITWLVGNEQTLVKYFSDKPKPTTLIATDVIEHIYNLNDFFICLRQLQLQKIVFTTGSVQDNYVKRKQLYKLMYKDEHTSNTPMHVAVESKFGSLPYVQVRQLLIQELYPKLSIDVCKKLATNTRGLNKIDIVKAVDKYLYTQQLPKPLLHPYNTCDPITGSFTERMLTIKQYQALFLQHGFTLTILNGYYNDFGSGIKKFVLNLANRFIKIFPKNYLGRCISPSIYLVGLRVDKNTTIEYRNKTLNSAP